MQLTMYYSLTVTRKFFDETAIVTDGDQSRFPRHRQDQGGISQSTPVDDARADQRRPSVEHIGKSAAHELNNALTSVLGWTQIARGDGLDPERRARALGAVEMGVRRAMEIADRLRDTGRLDVSGERRSVRLDGLVGDALELLAWRIDEGGICLDLSLEEGGICLADPAELIRVFDNLLRNAIEAMPEGGLLRVSTERSGGEIVVAVEDSGPGVPREAAAQIFEPFFTTKSRDERTNGQSGLGLAVCREIVESHGGTIDLEAAPGGGARFSVRLPIAGDEGSPARRTEPPVRSTFPPGIAVLVVEDDQEVGEMIRTALMLRGARISVVDSGEEAVDLCSRERFEAAFVDFTMRGLSGHDLARELKASRPEMPIVYMSGVEVEPGEHAVAFVKKPFDLERVQLVLAEVLGVGPPAETHDGRRTRRY
jgi:two-component system, cell cycle sensor histidine kinase and response regulator CckA